MKRNNSAKQKVKLIIHSELLAIAEWKLLATNCPCSYLRASRSHILAEVMEDLEIFRNLRASLFLSQRKKFQGTKLGAFLLHWEQRGHRDFVPLV